MRETAVFSGLEITERLKDEERMCGVSVIDIVAGQEIAFLQFEDALQEIFAACVLPGKRFPDLVNDDPELTGNTFVLPNKSLIDVPDDLRGSKQTKRAFP